MCNHPSQVGDGKLGMSGFVALDFLLKIHRAERVNLGAPSRLRDALCSLDEYIVARAEACNEFTDRAGAHHVVSEEFVAVLQPFRQRGYVRRAVLMQKVDSEPCRKLLFRMQRQERTLHR